jgi:hypothetical protein
VSCNLMCIDLKKEITFIVNNLFNNGVANLINEYVGSGGHVYELHSKTNDHDDDHLICDDCFKNMKAIALMCDTNQSNCPICLRYIYMP